MTDTRPSKSVPLQTQSCSPPGAKAKKVQGGGRSRARNRGRGQENLAWQSDAFATLSPKPLNP